MFCKRSKASLARTLLLVDGRGHVSKVRVDYSRSGLAKYLLAIDILCTSFLIRIAVPLISIFSAVPFVQYYMSVVEEPFPN